MVVKKVMHTTEGPCNNYWACGFYDIEISIPKLFLKCFHTMTVPYLSLWQPEADFTFGNNSNLSAALPKIVCLARQPRNLYITSCGSSKLICESRFLKRL